MNNDDTWQKWFDQEAKKLKPDDANRSGKRRYLHFDSRITELSESKTRLLLDPNNVAKHSFYPFIRIDTKEKRFRRMKGHGKGDRRRERTIKKRPIDYASHRDSLVYSWYGSVLSALYEDELARRGIGEHVIAYRSFKTKESDKGRTNVDFAKEAFDFIHAHRPCHVMAVDVSKFYEEINHDLLKRQWARLLGRMDLPLDHFNVFRSVTDYRFVRKARILKYITRARRKRLDRISKPSEFKKWIVAKNLQESGKRGEKLIGIPQGAPISCVLANIYMIDFDTAIAAAVKVAGGLYRRYSDDILIACSPEHAKAIEALVMSEVEKLNLKIKKEKTEHRLFIENEGIICALDPEGNIIRLQYLGVETDGTNHYIRSGSLARFQRRRNRAVNRALQRAAEKELPAPKRYLHKKFGVPRGNFLAYAKRAGKTLDSKKIEHQVSVLREARRLKERLE